VNILKKVLSIDDEKEFEYEAIGEREGRLII
jgi:hypothetical protein